MVEESNTPAGAPENPSVRYEPTDASFRWVLGILISTAFLGVLMYLFITGFFRVSKEHQASIKASHFPLAPKPANSRSPEPRLEQLNRLEGRDPYPKARATDESDLHSFGPAERTGYLHIPIERAMDLIPEKLPVRKDQPSDDQLRRQNGLVDDGEPNSGRLFREKKP